jgi:peptidoglycan/LPS O-acetylase OafA/YrhL
MPAAVTRRIAGIWETIARLPERLGRVTASTSYVPQIDGLRFLAIMPVLLWHSSIRGHRAGLANAGLAPQGEPTWMPVGRSG